MLIDEVDRYLRIRRSLGYKLEQVGRMLTLFATWADERGEDYIRSHSTILWASEASTRRARQKRLSVVAKFARFLAAEDKRHEVPLLGYFDGPTSRPVPYIFSDVEIERILAEATRLRISAKTPNRAETYGMLYGLLAATGMRISEALNLTRQDNQRNGVLFIRETKFHKSRLVPLHPTTADALDRYLALRARCAVPGDFVFARTCGMRIRYADVRNTFVLLLGRAKIAPGRRIRPRMHDLRHTFATRTLEQSGLVRGAIDRRTVALSTYLGHVDIVSTYWYLQATPELLTDMASNAESLVQGGAA